MDGINEQQQQDGTHDQQQNHHFQCSFYFDFILTNELYILYFSIPAAEIERLSFRQNLLEGRGKKLFVLI